MTNAILPPPGAPDIDIARAARLQPIARLAADRFGLPEDALVPYGRYKAKLIARPAAERRGKLVLVTAVTPTPAGEGKTTTTIGLTDGLNAIGVNAVACLREPSLGPCFGMKGGATGGGRAQIAPMEEINLHFTGDFHAITTAHALVSALLDNHLHWGNEQGIDPRRVDWRRAVDMNDRALRRIVVGLGGPAQGVPRETGFDITVASEIMAIFCLAESLQDLQRRLGDMILARRPDKSPVHARDIGADGAAAVLLKDAFAPNLVQTLENNPAFVHGGPFANIAHGCNSVAATRTALSLADVVVTEAGFGADLGAEKFLDIKCRQSGLWPDATVLVCTVRSLKMQGGVAKSALSAPDPAAVERGGVNLARHVANLRKFGLNPIVAVNHFGADDPAEIAVIERLCDGLGVTMALARHWAEGGAGAVGLAHAVSAALAGPAPAGPRYLYPDDLPLAEKIAVIAREIYGADGVDIAADAMRSLAAFEALGYGRAPVCIAKTQYSFSTDPDRLGAPSGHTITVREARLSAGAGFVVAICGDVMTMPGLPRRPAAIDIGLDGNGEIVGLA